ncbi:MAG: AAA family ATPase [Candidatus Woesearchaeota archaeon]
MSLEDNINKEHLKTIIDEYKAVKSPLDGIKSAIQKVGYPDRFSTLLTLSILSERGFMLDKLDINGLTEGPVFENIFKLSAGDFYKEGIEFLCEGDKGTETYKDHCLMHIPNDSDKYASAYYLEQFADSKIDLNQLIFTMNRYFRNRYDGVKTEFMRALNVAEYWIGQERSEGIAALFMDYALLRLNDRCQTDIEYIATLPTSEVINGRARSRILEIIKSAGISVKEDRIPDEYFAVDEPAPRPPRRNDPPKEPAKDTAKEPKKENLETKVQKQTPEEAKQKRRSKLLYLEDYMKSVIFEQDHAIDAIVAALINKETGLADPDLAQGFLFVGPSGVGKTELARQLNEYLFPGRTLLKIDGAEYCLEHEVAKLIGSPPGYVGSEDDKRNPQTGIIPTQLRKNEECVIVFDEIEKAHPKVRNFLFGLLDSKTMLDNHGTPYSPSKAIIIMTSNVGNVGIESAKEGIGFGSRQDSKKGYRMQEIWKEFPPGMLGRCDLVEFNTLSYEGIVRVYGKFLEQRRKTLYERSKLHLEISEEAREAIIKNSNWSRQGGREIKKNIERNIKEFSMEILKGDKIHEEETLLLEYVNNAFRYGVKSKDGQNTIYFLKKPGI